MRLTIARSVGRQSVAILAQALAAMVEVGVLKWYCTELHFGFVAPERGSEDVFVHMNENPDLGSIQQGERVSFERVVCGINVKPAPIDPLDLHGHTVAQTVDEDAQAVDDLAVDAVTFFTVIFAKLRNLKMFKLMNFGQLLVSRGTVGLARWGWGCAVRAVRSAAVGGSNKHGRGSNKQRSGTW